MVAKVVRPRDIPSARRVRWRTVSVTNRRRIRGNDNRSGEGKLSTKITTKFLLACRIVLDRRGNDSVAQAHQVSLGQEIFCSQMGIKTHL